MKIKRKDVVTIRSGILTGVRAGVIRVSKRTGGLTVQLIESRDAYKAGTTVNVAPYEVEKYNG